ncbi:MAG: dephospho-CoA kinase [Bacteroidales bacterium]|nr:dephospho-CoA kinase [Bacteroidales bacterium]
MFKVGLTGNIGSGKTLVCQIFETLGIPVFYADRVARNLYSEPEVRGQVIETFGAGVYSSEGQLIPQNLARIVFNDKTALQEINRIIHPGVMRKYLQWLEENADYDYILHEAAILFESNLQHEFDYIIMVTAPEKVRLQRVMERDALPESSVMARMKNQWPEKEKVQKSDFVIINDGIKFLIPQVLEIHNQLIEKKSE